MIRKLKRAVATKQATRDVVRMFSEDRTSRQEEARILNRRDNSVVYRDELISTAQLLSDLGVFAGDEELSSLAKASNNTRLGRKPADRDTTGRAAFNIEPTNVSNRSKWPGFALAAGLLVAITLVFNTFYQPTDTDLITSRYITRVGEQKTVDLDDGSSVTLNTSTELIAQFTPERRKVTLVRGEAYFDVAPAADQPFTVELGERSVTVLGTQFNILKAPDRITLAVAEGMVLFHRAEEPIYSTAPVLSPRETKEEVYLGQGQQRRVGKGTVVQFDTRQNTVLAYQAKNIDDIAEWRSGILQFNAAPLADVVRELNRYSAKKILIEDASVMDLELFATVRLDRIDEAISIFETSMPIQVVRHVDRIVILSNNPSASRQKP